MKKGTIIFIILLMFSGCEKKKEDVKIKDNIEGTYKLVSAFKYQEQEMISFNIGEKSTNFFMMITPTKIIFNHTIWGQLTKDVFEYRVIDNIIETDKENYIGTSKYRYELIKSPIKDNIILYEEQVDDTIYNIVKEYERITEEEYIKLIGENDEK